MEQNLNTRKARFAWFFRVEVFALLLVGLYYIVVEHTGHLIEYAGFIAIISFILFIVIVWFGYFPHEKTAGK